MTVWLTRAYRNCSLGFCQLLNWTAAEKQAQFLDSRRWWNFLLSCLNCLHGMLPSYMGVTNWGHDSAFPTVFCSGLDITLFIRPSSSWQSFSLKWTIRNVAKRKEKLTRGYNYNTNVTCLHCISRIYIQYNQQSLQSRRYVVAPKRSPSWRRRRRKLIFWLHLSIPPLFEKLLDFPLKYRQVNGGQGSCFSPRPRPRPHRLLDLWSRQQCLLQALRQRFPLGWPKLWP